MTRTLDQLNAEGHGLNYDFIDFPTAFAIIEQGLDNHDPKCSSAQTGGALLCDCDALPLKWAELKTAFDGSDGMALAAPYFSERHHNEG